jgi:hypothetical protein
MDAKVKILEVKSDKVEKTIETNLKEINKLKDSLAKIDVKSEKETIKNKIKNLVQDNKNAKKSVDEYASELSKDFEVAVKKKLKTPLIGGNLPSTSFGDPVKLYDAGVKKIGETIIDTGKGLKKKNIKGNVFQTADQFVSKSILNDQNKTLSKIQKSLEDFAFNNRLANTMKQSKNSLEYEYSKTNLENKRKAILENKKLLAEKTTKKSELKDTITFLNNQIIEDVNSNSKFISYKDGKAIEIIPQTASAKFMIYDTTGFVSKAFLALKYLDTSYAGKALSSAGKAYRLGATGANISFKLLSFFANGTFGFAFGRNWDTKSAALKAAGYQAVAYPFLLTTRLLNLFGTNIDDNWVSKIANGLSQEEYKAFENGIAELGVSFNAEKIDTTYKVGQQFVDNKGNIKIIDPQSISTFDKFLQISGTNDDIFGSRMTMELYRKNIRMGQDSDTALKNAVADALDVSPSGANLTDEWKLMNRLIPYAGVSAQAINTAVRNTKKYPIAVIAGGILPIVTTTILLEQVFENQIEGFKEVNDKLNQSQRMKGILIPTSGAVTYDEATGKVTGAVIVGVDSLIRPFLGFTKDLIKQMQSKDETGVSTADLALQYTGILAGDIMTYGVGSNVRNTPAQIRSDNFVKTGLGAIYDSSVIGKVTSDAFGVSVNKIDPNKNRPANLNVNTPFKTGPNAPTNTDIGIARLLNNLGAGITPERVKATMSQFPTFDKGLKALIDDIAIPKNDPHYKESTATAGDLLPSLKVVQKDEQLQNEITNAKNVNANKNAEEKAYMVKEKQLLTKYNIGSRKELGELFIKGELSEDDANTFKYVEESLKDKNNYKTLKTVYGTSSYNQISDSQLPANKRLELHLKQIEGKTKEEVIKYIQDIGETKDVQEAIATIYLQNN